MWSIINKMMPVLFFDATGSVIVEIKNQKKVFFIFTCQS